MNNEGSFNDEELRKRAASNEELNIRLTNNYAFQKIFKNFFTSPAGFPLNTALPATITSAPASNTVRSCRSICGR